MEGTQGQVRGTAGTPGTVYRITALPNGLRVVSETVPGVRSVTVGVWFRTGSRDEPDEHAGIAHLLEHMAFKGTQTRSARELAELVDRVGGQMNAYTSKEDTSFYIRVLDDHFGLAMEVLADMLLRPRFDPGDLEKEKRVILEELKMYEDDPEDVVQDMAVQILWPGHPLGRPVIGREATVGAVDRGVLVDFWRQHYEPGRAVIAVAGHVEHQRVVEEVQRWFGGWRRTGERVPYQPPAPQPADAWRQKAIEQVHLCVAAPAAAYGSDDLYPELVLANILGGASSSRLFQVIREDHGLAYSVYTFHGGYSDAGLFGIYAATSPETARQVMELIARECRKVRQDGVTRDELARTRDQIKANLLMGLESTSQRMNRLGRTLLMLDRVVTVEEVVARVEAVTAEQVMAAAERLLDPARWAVAGAGPAESMPLRGWLA
ncbi:peptidase M16 domain protein [Thermaerobacter marianensis DSM 12885]|uniref:Peptidase M16 domain protein n=1 Tax=Thermaerobacter marianensis (strain ATCC 700841 / DSM 12885 / JCM 10246 / 7p75a) TaxID=644966 RepID=E6SJS7_THEM7|nr:pitrilysin family protein [Thermaerobacter marianensis]ADU51140.1 peptidase M16 domain protein [Thermaerobacter marianensis DSM 12885]